MPEPDDSKKEVSAADVLASSATCRGLNARRLGWALFLIGVGDVVLRLWSAYRLHHLTTGIEDVANNPAKHFYHLVILPLTGAFLFKAYPLKDMRETLNLSQFVQRVALVLAVGLFALTLCLVFQHDKLDFYHRCNSPEDVGDFVVRSNFFTLREELKKTLPPMENDSYTTNAIIALRAFEKGREALFAANHMRESWMGLFTQRSLRAHISLLETLLGVLLGTIVLWSGLVFLLGRCIGKRKNPLPSQAIHAFLVCLSATLVWSPLMMYSEWYYHFKTLEERSPAIMNALVWLGLGGIVFASLLISTKAIKWVWGGFGVLGIALQLVFQTKPELFGEVAKSFQTSPVFVQVSIYVAATLAVGVAIISLWHFTPEQKLQRKQSPRVDQEQ